LVATHDIPARAAATSDLFTIERRTASQVDSDAMSDPKALAGNYTLVSIPAGSIATTSNISRASAETLPAELPLGMRAVSISIDNVKGVAGLITPGDRVDVIAVPPRNGDEMPRGYAILRGALVLAMGTDVQTTTAQGASLLNGPPNLSTVTLALTPAQVDLLAGADMTTALRLALRNPKESIGSLPAESLHLAPGGPASSNEAAPAPAVVPAPAQQQAPAPSSGSGVTVIDGDRVTSNGAASR
jgi:pilus assembly protein CpaB